MEQSTEKNHLQNTQAAGVGAWVFVSTAHNRIFCSCNRGIQSLFCCTKSWNRRKRENHFHSKNRKDQYCGQINRSLTTDLPYGFPQNTIASTRPCTAKHPFHKIGIFVNPGHGGLISFFLFILSKGVLKIYGYFENSCKKLLESYLSVSLSSNVRAAMAHTPSRQMVIGVLTLEECSTGVEPI